jgi:uncharacterized protein HemX
MNKNILIVLGIGGGLLFLYYNNKNRKRENINKLKNKIESAIKSGSLVITNTDNKLDTNQTWLDKLEKTINSDMMSQDELQKVSDGVDAYLGNYVGTKTKEELGNEMNQVLDKYQITR